MIKELEQLKFLFQHQPQLSKQASPHAPFAPTSAVDGDAGFRPLTSPSQKPKKKQIYLDFNSCYRLWNPIEMALEINKLKQEGFEVAVILQKTNGEIFASPIEDKAETGKKYDYKFKDKNGEDRSIFELSDEFIKENFSTLNHETSIEKLNLTRDESIILSFEQFDEVDKIFKQEYWDDAKKVSVRSSLSYSFFDGAVKKHKQYNDIVKEVINEKFKIEKIDQKFINILTHEDFNIEDQDTLDALKILISMCSRDFLSKTFKSIKNHETLEKLFYKIPDLKFEILEYLWFKHSDIEKVVSMAKSIDTFKDKDKNEIAESFFLTNLKYNYGYLNNDTNPEFDICDRISDNYIKNNLIKFTDRHSIKSRLKKIAKQKKVETSFGQRITVDFEYKNNEFIINLSFDGESKKVNLELFEFIPLFSDSDINQQFNLTTKFGDKIIELFKEKNELAVFGFIDDDSKFIEQLNENQKTQFLDFLKKNIDEKITNEKLKKPDALSLYLNSAIKLLQHFVDQAEIAILVKTLISKLPAEYPLSLNYELTPKFQDLLLEMHDKNEIDLNKITLPKKCKLFVKPYKSKSYHSSYLTKYNSCSLDFYLENKKLFDDEGQSIYFDKNRISSRKSTTLPLKITVFDLNTDSINAIKSKIDSGELDPSKILSVDVLGVIRTSAENTTNGICPLNNDVRPCLLMRFIQLFPNLKHARIEAGSLFPNAKPNENSDAHYFIKNTDVIFPEFIDFQRLTQEEINRGFISKEELKDNSPCSLPDKLKSLNIIADFYDSPTLETKEPGHRFLAIKTGDAIFMGDATGSGASEEGPTTTFSMKKTGKIINRPANQASLYIRNTSHKMNLNFAGLQDDLFVDVDESKEISFKESASIAKFSSTTFEAKKTELEKSDSQGKTICSFSKTLKSAEKTALLSISPDNKIIGYFTEPSSAEVRFFKDESGFYFVQSDKKCEIHYLIEGQELRLQTPIKDLKDLPENVKKIIDDYVGGNPANFPNSVRNDQYQLPTFTNQKQFLDDLFKIENKGSCRHRIASLAHKFEEKGLKCGKDFRIIGVNGNHVLMEVKKQNNEWATLELGGSEANMVETSEGQKHQKHEEPSNSPSNILDGLKSILEENYAKFLNGDFLPSPTNSPHNLSIESNIKLALDQLHQLKKVEYLKSFKENLEQFLTKEESSSLLLKTTRDQELKNYLLSMSSSSQNPPNPDSTDPIPTSLALSFQAFYASSPQDLTAKKPTLHIGDDNKAVNITANTPLLSFLENAKQHADKKHVLIIDWSNFDASSQVAFNTMFDKGARKIDDQKIPDNVKIVCIDSSKQKTTDSSILSRFDGGALDLSSIQKDQFTKSKIEDSLSSKATSEIVFDGEGLANWKEKLFGRIVVDGDAIKWEKSEFVKSLEVYGKDRIAGSNPDQPGQKNLHINFKNFSSKQQQEIKIFFEQAKASGSIDYHDYKITIPQDLSINFAQKEFEFAEVLKSFKPTDSSPSTSPDSNQLQLTIYQNSLASNQLPDDIYLINSYLFDQLLTQPQIDGNQYREELGLIAKAKESLSPLKLFLSEDLTKQQLYCLLNQAKEPQVALELYVAKGVKIPKVDLQKFTQEFGLDKGDKSAGGIGFSVARTSPSTESSRIIITNNIEESLNKTITAIKSSNNQSSHAKNINLVNVEDILYGDLFGKNQHKIVTKKDGSQNFAFEKIETTLKAKLDGGETVILKGEFSAELLSLLHPQILNLQKKFSNLHFIIEDKNVSKSRLQSSKLSWLDPSLYAVEYSPKIAKKTTEYKIVREDYPAIESSISDDSKSEADAFIKGRKDTLLRLLEQNQTLQIFGHSGVGKSSLLSEIEKSDLTTKDGETKDAVKVYSELSSLEAWAQDTSEKTKILVIDEFNIDDTHFTLFRDLANNPKKFPQEIFHDGKSFTLTQNHKVVFLGNPPNYGNRYKQKLFEDCQIPEWHLQDFPVSYIYEEILAKPIYEGLSAESKRKLSEKDFKKIALEEIKNYKKTNQGPKSDDGLPKETVRELQEKVLKKIVEEKFPIQSSSVQNANFITTNANQQNIDELQSAIEIRKLQKSGELPPQILGTCGVIFKGDSGVGKSVMIEAVLEERGITKIDSLKDFVQQIEREKKLESGTEITPATKPHYYCKISASLPIQEIEENLIKAFELGVIVVFDEMNTRIKEGGLEKTINQLLTDRHPKNSKIKSQPGFMIIASVNNATNSGRTALSPAILHRMRQIKAKSLSEYEAQDFEKIIGNWVENDKTFKAQQSNSNENEILKNFENLFLMFRRFLNKGKELEISKNFAKLTRERPKEFNNLRDLKKIVKDFILSDYRTTQIDSGR